jgi:hypothetical protein
MKKLVKPVVAFVKREWFLLIMLTAITLIVVLFEAL